ncbi:MAG: hypothetical protein C4339_00825 [Nitrososphaerota archaeon]
MLKGLLADDPLAEHLFSRSGLKPASFDIFLIQKTARKLKLFERLRLKDGGAVSKGAYYRSLRQGITQVRRCFYTLLLLSYLDLLDLDAISRALTLVHEAGRGPKARQDKLQDIIATLDALVHQLAEGKT